MHGVDQAAFVDVQAFGHMTESALLQIMLGRRVSQHTITLLKLWQDARRFGPENPPTGWTTAVGEFINHFLHFHRLDRRDTAAANVEVFEWQLAIRTGVLGVDRDDLIGLLFIKRGGP